MAFQRVCETFKIVDLNPFQREAIEYFVKKKVDVFVNLPTRYGKSLIYQADDCEQRTGQTRLLQFVAFVHLPFIFRSLNLFVASLLFMKGISWANTILVIRIYLLYLKTVLIIAGPGVKM